LFDVISVGGATQDVFVRTDLSKVIRIRDLESEQSLIAFKYGSKVNVDHIAFEVGGGGANTSVSFRRLGLHSALLAQIGLDEAGDQVRQHLRKEGVSTSLIQVSDDQSTGYSVILSSFEGERTVLTYRGANSTLRPDHVPWDRLVDSEWLYISSLSGDSNTVLDPIAQFAREKGLRVAFNPGLTQIKRGLQSLKSILEVIDILVLNKEEAAELTRKPLTHKVVDEEACIGCGICVDVCPENVWAIDPLSHKAINAHPEACDRTQACVVHCPTRAITVEPWASNVDDIMRTIYEFGPKVVVITDGKHGVQAYDGKFRYLLPPYPVQVVDTLGAGDAFASAFTAAYIRTKGDIETSLKMGAANAAGCVEKLGAQAGLRTELESKTFVSQHPEVTIRKSVLHSDGLPELVFSSLLSEKGGTGPLPTPPDAQA
jgi:sugar/nucleoside kinase (ribokinase family)